GSAQAHGAPLPRARGRWSEEHLQLQRVRRPAHAYHVLVVDELADLMDTHADTVFPILVRLGQLARAAGIHMMLATQRPAADTTPKKLVSNIPTRIGFMTQSAVESRIILGSKGAEDLKGNGD